MTVQRSKTPYLHCAASMAPLPSSPPQTLEVSPNDGSAKLLCLPGQLHRAGTQPLFLKAAVDASAPDMKSSAIWELALNLAV